MARFREPPRQGQRQLLLLLLAAVATACSSTPTRLDFPLDGTPTGSATTRQLERSLSAAAKQNPPEGLAADGPTAVAATNGRVTYNCTIAVRGFGNSSSTSDSHPQYGVQCASLSCSSESATAAPLQVGYNSSIMGLFVPAFKGVRPLANTSCQVKPFVNETALFYFCGDHDVAVQLWKPRVEGMWLEPPGDSKDFSLFAFAGNVSVFIAGGELLYNHAGTAFTVAENVSMTVSGTRVFNSTAKGGGALRMYNTTRATVTDQCVFSNNSADYGGAVYMYGNASLVVTGSSVLANSSINKQSDSSKGNGGAVYAKENAKIQISNRSRLENNTAPNGGALSLEGNAECNITSRAVIASNSVTDKTGGGVFLKENATCLLSNVTVMRNHAQKQGGGVGLEDKSRTVCVITDGSILSWNSAETQGGAVYVGPGSAVVISGGTQLSNNSAISGGGVFLNAQDSKGRSYVNITGPGTALVANRAQSGAAINVNAADGSDQQCYVTVVGGVRITESGSQIGGAAYVGNGMCNAMFVDVVFDRNTDLKHSGVFSIYQSSNVTFINCTLSRSTAKDAGAATVGESASATFINSIIESHQAVHSGGALRVVENSRATFINSTIRNCSALSGGAVDIQDNGTVVLYNSTFMHNHATTNGGAVSTLGPGTPTFQLHDNSRCMANTAGVAGGCAYLLTAGQVEADTTGVVAHNTARFGGGIALAALDKTPGLDKLRKAARNNTARMFGQDLYVDYTDVNLTLSNISVNGVPLPVDELARTRVIPYVSRSSGPGLNISVTANSTQASTAASHQLPPAANIKVEAQLLDDNGTAAAAAATTAIASSSDAVSSHYEFLGSATTDDNGTALFPDLQPRLHPGNYTLALQYTRLDGVPFRQLYTLAVRPCVLGEYTSDSANQTCDVCPAGQYCLSPSPWNRACEQCNTKTADCSAGGAVVVPLPGYWQRSPDSALLFRCFNPAACRNDYHQLLELHPYRDLGQPALDTTSQRRALLVDSGAAYSSPSSFIVYNSSSTNGSATGQEVGTYLAAQCAVGYGGTLCATCQQGYGMTKQYTCSKCLSAQAVAVLYALGAVVLMIVIRIMMHLSTTSDSVGMKRWTAAVLATGRLRPTTTTAATAAANATATAATAAAAAAEEGRATRRTKAAGEPIAAASQTDKSAGTGARHTSSGSVPVVNLVGTRLEVTPHTSVASRQRLVPALPSSVLKVLVLYMQYMLIISGMQVDWPDTLARPFLALAGLWGGASSEALSLECLMPGKQAAAMDAYAAAADGVSSAGQSAAPLGVLRVLLFVVVPIVMYVILIAAECVWSASKPWIEPAFHRCMTKHVGARVGGFIPGFAQWQQARSEGRGFAAPEPAGSAEIDSEEEAYRGLGELEGDDPDAATAVESGIQSASAQPAGPGTVNGSTDGKLCCWYFPSAAWCGVLAMVTVFFFLTSLARAALGLFMCYTLDADPRAVQEHKQNLGQESLWMLNLSEQCMGPEHRKWALGLGIPLVVLLYVCLPVAVGVLLFRYRYQLTNSWVQRHFGFLYVHYRPEYYLWEVVTILQTLFVVVSSVTANYIGVYNQALLLNAVLALIFTMLVLFKPNASREIQVLNYASVGVQLFTTYAALSFVSASDSAVAIAAARGDDGPVHGFELYKTIMGVIVLLANLAFIIGLILVLLSTLPSAFWQGWKRTVRRHWHAFRVRCRTACWRRRAPAVAQVPSMLAARTASGHPVLVRLDAHKQLQMATARGVNRTNSDQS